MKYPILPVAVMFFLPLLAIAQSSAFWGLDHPRGGAAIPTARLVKPAESLVATVTIAANNRNSLEQTAALTIALQTFRKEAARLQGFAIKEERATLGGGEPGYLSSAKFDTNRSSSDLRLTYGLRPDTDAIVTAAVLRDFVGNLKLPGGVAVRIESMQIELNDAGSLRDSLLAAIATEVTKLQNIFPGATVQIGGLERSVEQRAINDREVVAYIPYTLTLDTGKH